MQRQVRQALVYFKLYRKTVVSIYGGATLDSGLKPSPR